MERITATQAEERAQHFAAFLIVQLEAINMGYFRGADPFYERTPLTNTEALRQRFIEEAMHVIARRYVIVPDDDQLKENDS